MSYDIRLLVKVDGTDIFAEIGRPERDSPTYNLGNMFRACMDWDYQQGEVYNCKEVLPKISKGITELITHKRKYKAYEPSNGWGTMGSAVECLMSLCNCIHEYSEEIPLEHLYMRW